MAGFEEQIRRFADKAEAKANRVVRSACLDLFSKIVTRTPVDTGRARANWQIELDAMPPAQTINDRNNPPDDKDDTARRKIDEITDRIGDVDKATRTICLANNLAYIKALEYGHSQKQAPNGMVRISVAEWDNIVKTLATERS